MQLIIVYDDDDHYRLIGKKVEEGEVVCAHIMADKRSETHFCQNIQTIY